VLSELCGESDEIKRLRDELHFAAQTPQPLLLLGETGTGKGVCARVIHQLSPRRGKSFVHYQPNFGGGDIVQSELFGHTKGAFTGAVEARKGLALEADGGTIFIDELDSIPKDTQVLLLDLVQERRVRALGSDRYQSANCRFIAATNKALPELLAAGTLRRDLHHRLAHNIINLPPLRDRLSDIPPLVKHFLESISDRDGLNVFEVSAKLLLALQSYSWPGNIRELQGVIETAAYRAHFCGRSVVDVEDARFGCDFDPSIGDASSGEILNFNQQVESFKRELVKRALSACGGNQLQAAVMLGIDRGTVSRLK
jgi:DNA-binding NtrC family response regulator